MFGLFLAALEAVVLRKLGSGARHYVRKQIGLTQDDEFYYEEIYNNNEFYTMLEAAVDYSDFDQEVFLTLCGAEICDLHQTPQHCSDINFWAFLHNLESISGYDDDVSAFHCAEDPESDTVLLHYYYQWKGLETIAVGFIKDIAKNIYCTSIEMELLTVEKRKKNYHACFAVKDIANIPNFLTLHDNEKLADDASLTIPSITSDSEVEYRLHNRITQEYFGWPITPEVFNELFPFNIVFDSNLIISGLGNVFNRLCPAMINCSLRDYFKLRIPAVSFTYDSIVLHQDDEVYLECCKGCSLKFKGQMIVDTPSALIVYICYPIMDSLQQMSTCKIFVSDLFYLVDCQETIFLSMHLETAKRLRKKFEVAKKSLNTSQEEKKIENQRALDLLHSILPSFAVEKYLRGEEFKPAKYESVTVLFSDIEDFTNICDFSEPLEAVKLLDTLFSEFDHLSEIHGVFKLESYNDVYIVSGTDYEKNDCPDAVLAMAFAMRKKAMATFLPDTTDRIKIRIGIHTGPVVVAVLNRKMPHFCMFGHTVNKASRMCTHGSYGKIHVSAETHDVLIKANPDFCLYQFECRGDIPVKGLGNLTTYFVEPCQELTEIYHTNSNTFHT